MKKNDQMYTLLAICLTLCPQVRKALGLISVSLVDHENQACGRVFTKFRPLGLVCHIIKQILVHFVFVVAN